MSDVATKLREARKLIERGWTKREFARGRSGKFVDPEGNAAVCWCASGAIDRVATLYGKYESAELNYQSKKLFKDAIGSKSIVLWNDAPERTKAEVLAAFDKAIELAESGK